MKIAYDPEDNGRIVWMHRDNDVNTDHENTATVGQDGQIDLPDVELGEDEREVYYYNEDTGEITGEAEQVPDESAEGDEAGTIETTDNTEDTTEDTTTTEEDTTETTDDTTTTEEDTTTTEEDTTTTDDTTTDTTDEEQTTQ